MSQPRRRFALVGTGARARLYLDAIAGPFAAANELVALCDANPGRLALAAQLMLKQGAAAPATYAAADFDRMIRETRPQTIIVATPDAAHDDYLVRALDAGCEAITEKPITTTPDKAQRILDACQRNQHHLRVLFNYRYSPPRMQVKQLLMSGAIGDILSVEFNWLLNTEHGADYFRRWHSHKANSGGLMVHKATHHFDLVNWWLGALPETVLAQGKREFYTPAMAQRLGLTGPHERCRTCPEQAACTFFLDLGGDVNLKALYIDCEGHDGYYRDQCVFRPDIDIEDAMNVIVSYNTGASLSYSLNASSSWEGYRIAFNGTHGRLEHDMVEQVYVAGADMVQGEIAADGVGTRIIPLRGAVHEIEPWVASGGHGGGDVNMLQSLFGTPDADPLGCIADERGGVYAMLVGAAANRCFETGRAVHIADLVTGLRAPDIIAMPSRTSPVPMPRRVGYGIHLRGHEAGSDS